MIVLYVLGYIFVGLITRQLISNKILMSAYNRKLAYTRRLYTKDSYPATGMNELEREHMIHKRALEDAEESSDVDRLFGGVMGGTFWPVGLTLLMTTYLYEFIGKAINHLPKHVFSNKAEKKIAKLSQEIEEAKEAKVRWEDALKQLDAAGIDITELKKMKIYEG